MQLYTIKGNANLCWRRYFFLVFFSVLWAGNLQAQNPVTITIIQDVNFGAFAVSGSGGTITVSSEGVRSATGGVVLLGNDYHGGLFREEAPIGSYLNLTSGTPATLNGSNGGQMNVELNETYPAFPFNTIAPFHDFQFGAVLTVGPAGETPPGVYNGSFEIVVSYD